MVKHAGHANLIPAKKGEVRNPRGRPRFNIPSQRAAISNAITQQDVEDILRAAVAMAKAGDIAAMHFVFDRCFGKPKESLEVTDNGGLSSVKTILFKAMSGTVLPDDSPTVEIQVTDIQEIKPNDANI